MRKHEPLTVREFAGTFLIHFFTKNPLSWILIIALVIKGVV